MRSGSRGESVQDLQQRLTALGFGSSPDEPGTFGFATEEAVRGFQRHGGLRSDGICGRQTWAALVEAGRVLGDRLLYYKRPMQRGDDVAGLQRRLGALGFDAGRVDGIFGPQTDAALRDFQRNVGLPVDDGIMGPETLTMLLGVSTRSNPLDVVAEIRERLRLRDAPPTLLGRRVVVGETGGLAALADSIRRVLHRAGSSVVTLHDPDESVQASQANLLRGDVYLGVRLEPSSSGCSTAYFMGYSGGSSEGGRRLAEMVQATVPQALGIPDRGMSGMRFTVLRETRMPAVVVELGPPKVVVERGVDVAAALARALQAWVFAPCDEPASPTTTDPRSQG